MQLTAPGPDDGSVRSANVGDGDTLTGSEVDADTLLGGEADQPGRTRRQMTI
jgi:hypothetical protein